MQRQAEPAGQCVTRRSLVTRTSAFARLSRSRPTSIGTRGSTTPFAPLRLDEDVVQAYRETGEGWQTRINADLRRARKLKVRTATAPRIPKRASVTARKQG